MQTSKNCILHIFDSSYYLVINLIIISPRKVYYSFGIWDFLRMTFLLYKSLDVVMDVWGIDFVQVW